MPLIWKAACIQLGEYSHNRELAYVGGGAGFAASMREAVEKSGATVLLSTRAQSLNVEDGKVTGVTAQANEGTTYVITAENVILATGGYGRERYPAQRRAGFCALLRPVHLDRRRRDYGDRRRGINAATRLMEYGKRYPNGVEVSKGIAKSTIAGNITAGR